MGRLGDKQNTFDENQATQITDLNNWHLNMHSFLLCFENIYIGLSIWNITDEYIFMSIWPTWNLAWNWPHAQGYIKNIDYSLLQKCANT